MLTRFQEKLPKEDSIYLGKNKNEIQILYTDSKGMSIKLDLKEIKVGYFAEIEKLTERTEKLSNILF